MTSDGFCDPPAALRLFGDRATVRGANVA